MNAYRSVLALAAATAIGFTFAGCSGSKPISTATPSASVASSAVLTTTTPAIAMDARAVVDALAAAGLPLSNIAVQDENTDPNDRIGRPGGYTSRASADLPDGDKEADKYTIDRGLVIEVFAIEEDADARSKYIQDTLKTLQILGTEYHYRSVDRRILVRITGKVKPSLAKQFEVAVTKL
jgi:hypothetical protein